MILVDSSVWIDHLRHGSPGLIELLDARRVLVHPFVIGELALGNLRQRNVILSALRDLPSATVAGDEEVAGFIETHRLFGQGIGYVDAHLLAAVKLMPGAALWTVDRRLRAAAMAIGLTAAPPFTSTAS